MPKIMIDECLLMIIVAGMGLTVAYLRAGYVSYRGFKPESTRNGLFSVSGTPRECVSGTMKCLSPSLRFGQMSFRR
jgi:hypothetical protein